MSSTYYNEIDPYAAEWLRNLIAARLIPAGDVDERSIVEVSASDLRGYTQAHFFAGIGGWAYAARLAGWPDDRPLWTGSCPCQPFSVAGKGAGTADERHLWPTWFQLIRECQPPVVMGEQVAAAVGKSWLDGVFADLEGAGYACGAAVLPACSVGAPHRRDRLWFVADANSGECDGRAGIKERGPQGRDAPGGIGPEHGRNALADACPSRLPIPEQPGQPGQAQRGICARSTTPERSGAFGAGNVGDAQGFGSSPRNCEPSGDFGTGELERSSAWSSARWIMGADGKARRVGTRVRLLADGLPAGVAGVCAAPVEAGPEIEVIPLLARDVPARVGKLKAFGNAIVPQVAAEVIRAFMDCRP